MPEVQRVVIGVLVFFFGLIYTFVSYYTVPKFIDVISTSGSAPLDATVQGIFWIGLILTWVIALVVAPIHIITTKS